MSNPWPNTASSKRSAKHATVKHFLNKLIQISIFRHRSLMRTIMVYTHRFNHLMPTVASWAFWCSAVSVRVPRCQKLNWRLNPVWHRMPYGNWLLEQGLTFTPTQYRLYGRRFLQVWWPNQQCRNTEGGWLVIQTGLSLTMLTSPCYNTTTCMQI